MKKSPKRKATIRDIAELVGVHHSTVSRALNAEMRAKISPAVVRKIERAAAKLGYYPNIVASSLKQNRSFAIGVLIPDLMNPVFPPIIRGIQDTAEAAGYTVITANTDDEPDKESESLRMMQGRLMDGVLIATARREDPIVEQCIDRQIPFVLVNRTVDRTDVHAVIVDEDFAIRSTLDHLLKQGHERIAHVAGPAHTSTGYERATTFRTYMRACNQTPDLVVSTNKFTTEEGARAFRKLLSIDDSFTAVVAGSDLVALGCIDAMAEAGLKAPGDISIVGGNDMPFLSRMDPALTTVAIPKYEMGARAATTLLDIIAGKNEEPVVTRLQPRLVVRNSTAPPR